MKQGLARFLWCFLFAPLLLGSLPASDFGDIRNRDDSRTKSHFNSSVYHSRTEWEDRREELKRQILLSTGLWPLPEKTHLAPATPEGRQRAAPADTSSSRLVIRAVSHGALRPR
jgi:hypothetical protein